MFSTWYRRISFLLTILQLILMYSFSTQCWKMYYLSINLFVCTPAIKGQLPSIWIRSIIPARTDSTENLIRPVKHCREKQLRKNTPTGEKWDSRATHPPSLAFLVRVLPHSRERPARHLSRKKPSFFPLFSLARFQKRRWKRPRQNENGKFLLSGPMYRRRERGHCERSYLILPRQREAIGKVICQRWRDGRFNGVKTKQLVRAKKPCNSQCCDLRCTIDWCNRIVFLFPAWECLLH